MKMEENASVARRWFEDLFNTGNLDEVDEIVAPNHTIHDSSHPNLPSGPKATQEIVEFWRSAFPDVHVTIEDQIVEGDKVVLRWTASGTQDGEFMGTDPTHLPVTVMGITISRVSDGKIAETWNSFGDAELMDTLGVLGDADMWPFR
jgi:predicted ester cyclase